MNKPIRLLLWLLFATGQLHAQQRVQFSQYMFSGIVINPAYTGSEEALSVSFINRNQWSGVENAPSSQTFSAHSVFLKQHLGLGLLVIRDRIGVHENLSTSTTYAYHLKTGNSSFLSMGLQAGIHSRKSDYASLLPESSFDPKVSGAHISSLFFDVGAGLYFRSKNLDVGLSAPQLIPETVQISDSVSVSIRKSNLFLFTRYRIPISEVIEFEPSVLIKHFSNSPISFDLNTNFVIKKALTLGLSYRKSESIDFLMKGQITRQLQIGYAYDHTIGRVAQLSNGSHELMINYLFKYTQSNASSPR